MNKKSIELFNADYQSLGMIDRNKAFRLLALGKAVVHEIDAARVKLRDWEYPISVRLTAFVKVNHSKIYGPAAWSRSGVLRRDNYKCGYCGKAAKTIDHILPRSRGGQNSWTNCIAADFKCNNFKRNRTPEEAGMKLLWEPTVPTKQQLRQKKIDSR